MSLRLSGGVPPELLRRSARVLRPADARGIYAYPRPEFARLVNRGALRRLAQGYYAVVPSERIGDTTWKPDVEAAAWGIAAADYGANDVALMGVSAARIHGAFPRALGVAVVAVPKQRPALRLLDRKAEVLFVRRNLGRLDVQRVDTELGSGWVTTVEQTLLDLAARPDLGSVANDVRTAISALKVAADQDLLTELAVSQRRQATLQRLTGER